MELTHSLTRDIRMPQPSDESHDRRLERILIWYLDVDIERASFVWRAWWAIELPHQFRYTVSHSLDLDV